jgi:hypothetical protein
MLVVLGIIIAALCMLSAMGKQASSSRRHRQELRTRRLELLADALREPGLDAATRADILRALANERHGFGGWLWRQLQRPMLWKALWFGTGWMTMLIAGAAVVAQLAGAEVVHRWDMPALVLTAVSGFGMVTLPLALRELLRRERSPQPR